METTPSIPSDHSAYDAQLLHAACKPAAMVIRENLRSPKGTAVIRNPWLTPWHNRPSYDLLPPTIRDFENDLRPRLIDVIERQRALQTPTPFEHDVLQQSDHFFEHFSHIIVQHAVELHAGHITLADMVSWVRQDLQRIFPQKNGAFAAETPAYPFWEKKHWDAKQDNGQLVRFFDKKPTKHEKSLACWLAGPDFNLKGGSTERLGYILTMAQSYLVTRHPQATEENFPGVREELLAILDEKQTDWRKQFINHIAEVWDANLQAADKAQMQASSEPWTQSVAGLTEHCFTEAVMQNKEQFLIRKVLLEQISIMLSLERCDAKEPEEVLRAEEDIECVERTWRQAMGLHTFSVSDYPMIGLAFFAMEASYAEREKLREMV